MACWQRPDGRMACPSQGGISDPEEVVCWEEVCLSAKSLTEQQGQALQQPLESNSKPF